jgi:hypothetical protein
MSREPTTVYITAGSYSDYSILGATLDKGYAETVALALRADVEEWALVSPGVEGLPRRVDSVTTTCRGCGRPCH